MTRLVGVVAISLAVAASAHAGVVDQVVVSDEYYGPYSGSIDSGATGSAAILYWESAVYGAIFTIDFTDSAGIVTDVLFSDAGWDDPVYPGDSLEFDGYYSGDLAIGTVCTPSATTACLQTTGAFQDVTALIGTFNGGQGIFEGGDISILADDAPVPEPASLWLCGAAMLGLLGIARRKATA